MPTSTILDQFGNPAPKPTTPTPFQSIASFKSRRESLEYPIRNLDPQNFDRALRDADEGNIRDWMELCEEMEDRDGQIASKLATRKKMVAACP